MILKERVNNSATLKGFWYSL